MTNTKRGLLAGAIALALGMVLTTSGSSVAGFCCPSVKTISLQPIAGAPVKVRGMAEIDECLGMSFLRIVVRARVADGTGFIPAFPSLNPLLGEWFYTTAGRAETVWQNLTLGEVTGRELVIMDDTFTPVASGQF